MSDNLPKGKHVVLDASAALAFALKDEKHHPHAVALVADLLKRELRFCAPSIFAYECDSVIRRRAHLATLTPKEAREARELMAVLGVEIAYDPECRESAYSMAERYDQPRVYDAIYAAFAEARGLELWTDDERFYNAVTTGKNPIGFVKFLGSYL